MTLFLMIAMVVIFLTPAITLAGTAHWKPYSYGKVVYKEHARGNKESKIVYKDAPMRLTNRRPYCGTGLRSPITLSQERGIIWVFKKASR